MIVPPSRVAAGFAGLCILTGFWTSARLEAAAPEKPTFTEHVAPVIFQNCASCHRPGQGAPFTLLDYRDVRKRGSLIQNVTESKYMPPWPPAEGWGCFDGERRLTDDQIDLISRWVETGMEEGPKEKLPPLPKFPAGGWSLGEPDIVLTLPEAFEVPADGPDIYRGFALPLNLPEDAWVTAVEIQPTARSVVHHALYFIDSSGRAMEQEKADPKPGFRGMGIPRTGSLGGWAVGATAKPLPMGLAYHVPKGADFVVQVHFHPSGKPQREQTSYGLYLAKKKPEKRILGTQTPLAFGLGTKLKTEGIKAGNANFTINGVWEVPFDVDLVNVGGHAHYLCTTMKTLATLPSGEQIKLFAIDDWDFNWQGRYNYCKPVRLPKGTRVKSVLTYDNSSDNPRNPSNPPVDVSWGEGSTDEMGSVTFTFVAVDEADVDAYRGPSLFVKGDGFAGGVGDGSGSSSSRKGAGARGALQALRKKAAERGAGGGRAALMNPDLLLSRFDSFDKNQDGKVDADELPEQVRGLLDRLDVNHDDAITKKEIRDGFRVMRNQFRGEPDGAEQPDATPAADGASPAPDAAKTKEKTSSAESAQGMQDLDGRIWKPFAPGGKTRAHVLVFVTGDCPVANIFSPEIARLSQDYAGKGVQFFLVEVDPDAPPDQVAAHAKEYALDLPILLDRRHELVRRVGAKTTPEAAVVAPDGRIVYSGRIDDRFGKLGRQRPEPSRRELKDALDAVLDGKPVAVARTEAIGCPIADLGRE